jgi:hypothetical protein
MDNQLIDRIYECAFVPEFWPVVLHKIARVADARGGLIFAANTEIGVLRWMASKGLEQELARYVSEGWLERDRRRDRVIGKSHAGFLADHDVYTNEEMAADPVYREFLLLAASVAPQPPRSRPAPATRSFSRSSAIANAGRLSLPSSGNSMSCGLTLPAAR